MTQSQPSLSHVVNVAKNQLSLTYFRLNNLAKLIKSQPSLT
jgi:hypothetical protein